MASGRDNKRGLGRGLSALMADVTEAEKPVQGGPAAELFVPIEQIEANPDQPRKQFVQAIWMIWLRRSKKRVLSNR